MKEQPKEEAKEPTAKLWEALVHSPDTTMARDENEIHLSPSKCRQLSYLDNHLNYLADNVSLLLPGSEAEKATAKKEYLSFRTALKSVQTFVNSLDHTALRSGKTTTLGLLPQAWVEAFPKTREALVGKISAIDERLGRRCETAKQAEKIAPKGDAKALVEYLQTLDRVHATLQVQLPMEQLAKKSSPSMHLNDPDKKKINFFPAESALKSIQEAGLSIQSLTELNKLASMQKALQDSGNRQSRISLNSVPLGADFRVELEVARERIIESLPQLPEQVTNLFENDTISPVNLGKLIRAANKRSSNEDNANHTYIMGTSIVEEKYYEATRSLLDAPVSVEIRKNYDAAFKKLDACHSIDLLLAIVAPALDKLEVKMLGAHAPSISI